MAVRAAAGMFGEMKVTGGSQGGRGGGKARKYDLGSTNIAGLGTDLEKAVRQAAAEGEPAWTDAGKKVGIEVWRIEKFKVVPWPKKKHGTFYSGDSYIVLHTYHKKGNGAMMWDVHFWIGKDSTQDEYGTAAYKTVELDDYLGGLPTQYREVQDHESRAFLKLFKRFLTMEGGVDSGFNHVEEKTYRPRLLQCKGRMNVLVKEVPLTYKSLNQGDSFIYDGGMKIFVWHGKDARPMEKAKAMNMAQALDDERGGKPEREVFEDGDNNPTQKEWWHAIGGKGDIKSAAEGGDDEQVAVASEKRLMSLSDQSGRLKLQEVASGDGIRRDLLHSQDVFILDDGYEVMVWVGLEASRGERKAGLDKAVEYLKQFRKPLDTPISRFMEGGENDLFEAAFEVGVMSMARPGGGTKFGAGGLGNMSRTKAVAASGRADYKGNGGQGTATDFDALYAQQGADPADWQGRQGGTSAYARELQDGQHGAYNPDSGWVSGMSADQRATRDARIATLEQDHASGKYAKAGSGGAAAAVDGVVAVVQHPTIVPAAPFDPNADAKALRKAMKGLGTNDNKLIEILAYRTTEQRQYIRAAFGELCV